MRKIEQAKSINVHVCEHGTLMLTLYDDDGRAFAVACFDPTHAVGFMDDVTAQMERAINAKAGATHPDGGCVH